jgi:hypothetical protein
MIPPAGPRFVAYYRITTDKQGRPSGGRLASLTATFLYYW